ncbi:hypothetical protein LEP1GSC080_4851 [Leptospira interrogans str. FPW2026]|nr:hypothetical protein LEP1GSC080_4851 [Leptospira interrogans str. FPW2026]
MSLKIPTIIQKYLVVTHVRELEFPFYRENISTFCFDSIKKNGVFNFI